jgi:predicted transcriptional regulator
MRSVVSPVKGQEGRNVALLKTPLKRPRTTTLQIRLEEEVKLKLENSAQFIEATPSYVTTEALKLLFKKDAEFKHWLEHHHGNSDEQEHEGGLFTKIA